MLSWRLAASCAIFKFGQINGSESHVELSYLKHLLIILIVNIFFRSVLSIVVGYYIKLMQITAEITAQITSSYNWHLRSKKNVYEK